MDEGTLRINVRADVIQELMATDGVPCDRTTAVALISLGVQLYYDCKPDKEYLALILEQWADGVRHGEFIGKPATHPKGDQ